PLGNLGSAVVLTVLTEKGRRTPLTLAAAKHWADRTAQVRPRGTDRLTAYSTCNPFAFTGGIRRSLLGTPADTISPSSKVCLIGTNYPLAMGKEWVHGSP